MTQNPQMTALQTLIARVPNGDFQTSNRVKNALQKLFRSCEIVANFKADLMKSEVGNNMLQNQERAHLRNELEKARAELSALVGAFASEQAAERALKARLIPGEFDSELRGVVRALEAGARLQFINNAFEVDDAKTIAAILTAPPALSGLTQAQHDQFTGFWLDRCAPYDRDFVNELKSVIDTSLGIVGGFTKPVGGASLQPTVGPFAMV